MMALRNADMGPRSTKKTARLMELRDKDMVDQP